MPGARDEGGQKAPATALARGRHHGRVSSRGRPATIEAATGEARSRVSRAQALGPRLATQAASVKAG